MSLDRTTRLKPGVSRVRSDTQSNLRSPRKGQSNANSARTTVRELASKNFDISNAIRKVSDGLEQKMSAERDANSSRVETESAKDSKVPSKVCSSYMQLFSNSSLAM